MLDSETKRRIDTARDILVGKVPDPKSQVEQITIALIYKFMDDMDAQSEEFGGKRTFFAGEFERYGWAKLMRSGLGGFEMLNLYAEAIAKGEAEINLCPPGGMEGVQRLADLLGREVKPLDAEEKPKQVAIIDENTCIGCTLCIQACPVDAIIGAAKQLHVIIGQQCTGCELCLPPCPVDCIDLVPAPAHRDAVREADATRTRYEFRQFRLQRDDAERDERLRAKRPSA